MIINKYRNRLIDKFGAKYKEVTGQGIEDFLDNNLDKISDIFMKLYKQKDLYLSDFQKRVEKTMRRWVKAEIDKENSSLYKEFKIATELYNKIKDTSPKGIFENIYNCDTPEELLKKNKEKLLKWKADKEYFLDFPYIKEKRLSAIKPAVCNDIIVYLLNIYGEEEKDIVKVPSMLQEIPEDTTNRVKVGSKKDVIEDESTVNKQVYYNEDTGEEISFTIDKNEYLSFLSGGAVTELDKEIRTEMFKQLKVFNSLDRDLLQYVLQQTKELYSADKIERDLSEIVLATGRKNNKTARDDVKNALYKLGSSGYKKDGKFVGRFFSVRIEPVKDKQHFKDVVHIYIDGMLREVILSNNTFNFYADNFNLLSKDAQKILISLQNERILRVLNNNPDLFTRKTFSDFKKVIYFNNKRTIKQRILSALDELVKYKMSIKNYRLIDKYEVEIEFFKFAERDIILITGEDFKYGDFVDGSYDLIG